jgi:hypothetical protein
MNPHDAALAAANAHAAWMCWFFVFAAPPIVVFWCIVRRLLK